MWFNRSFLIALFLGIFGQSQAQLLWKATTMDSSKTLYLFGTMHLPMGDYVQDHKGLQDVLNECDCLYTETSLETDSIVAVIQDYIYLPKGVHVQDSLSAREWEVLDSILLDISPMFSATMFNQMKPLYISTFLVIKSMQQAMPDTTVTAISIDRSFHNYAQLVGIENRYLESQEQQLQYLFNDISLASQFRMLKKSLFSNGNQDTLTQMMYRMPFVYQKQDLDSIAMLVNYSVTNGTDEKEMYNILLDQRNMNWVQEMVKLTNESDDILFFAVGCGHLTGPMGLISLLREQGFVVEPMHYD